MNESQCSASFNSILKQVMKMVLSKSNKLKSHSLTNKIKVVLNEDPLYAIETTGPYLLKYSKEIKAYDGSFFLNHDYTEDMDDDDPDMVVYIVGVMKKLYTENASEDDKEFLVDKLDDLLILYCTLLKMRCV